MNFDLDFPTDRFDFEACCVYSRMPGTTTIVTNGETRNVSFRSERETERGNRFNRCDCVKNARKLKYMMKGFFEEKDLESELKMAEEIFGADKCAVCDSSFLKPTEHYIVIDDKIIPTKNIIDVNETKE